MRWAPPPSLPDLPYTPPPFWTAVRRGAQNRCPVCGEGHVFAGYLRLVTQCESCGAPLGRLRADDAPPYFTILITGHLLVPVALWVEKAWMPPIWLHMAIWLPLFAVVCTLLLRPIKGAVVGWMTSLGFTGDEHGAEVAAALPASAAGARHAPGDDGARRDA
jgi:uncharacterized protein (DUF983 family)